MKIVVLILLSILVSVGSAQKHTDAELIWEVEKPNCEMLRAFLDLLTSRLQAESNSQGVIVIKGDASDMRANVIYESLAIHYFDRFKDLQPRVSFLRAQHRSKMELHSWIIPAGATFPKIETSDWSYVAPAGSRPFQFTWEDNYDDICPEPEGVRLFADFLKANPAAHGNIVIRDVSRHRISQKQIKVLKELTKGFGIPRSQLRVFKRVERPTGMLPHVEYWFVS